MNFLPDLILTVNGTEYVMGGEWLSAITVGIGLGVLVDAVGLGAIFGWRSRVNDDETSAR